MGGMGVGEMTRGSVSVLVSVGVRFYVCGSNLSVDLIYFYECPSRLSAPVMYV